MDKKYIKCAYSECHTVVVDSKYCCDDHRTIAELKAEDTKYKDTIHALRKTYEQQIAELKAELDKPINKEWCNKLKADAIREMVKVSNKEFNHKSLPVTWILEYADNLEKNDEHNG